MNEDQRQALIKLVQAGVSDPTGRIRDDLLDLLADVHAVTLGLIPASQLFVTIRWDSIRAIRVRDGDGVDPEKAISEHVADAIESAYGVQP